MPGGNPSPHDNADNNANVTATAEQNAQAGAKAEQNANAGADAQQNANSGADTQQNAGPNASGNDPVGTVRRMFAAFRSGDLDALLETVHPDSHWTYIGANPRLSKGELIGHARVRRFFERILERLDMTAFNMDQWIVQGDTVVIFGSESGTVKATGDAFHNEWVQKYVVNDNLITRMVEYNIQIEQKDHQTRTE